MGLFNLFGGKKKDEAKPPSAVKPVEAKPVEKAAEMPAAKPVAAAAPPPSTPITASGAEQVKLRLKLAAAVRSGQTSEAYTAAKSLADIQAKAGRRLGARMWMAEADKILARDPKAA